MSFDSFEARVEVDGKRVEDREGVPVFLGLGPKAMVHHGVLGDGAVRLALFKMNNPTAWRKKGDKLESVPLEVKEAAKHGLQYAGEIDGIHVQATELVERGFVTELRAELIEPDGRKWRGVVRWAEGHGPPKSDRPAWLMKSSGLW